MSDASNLWPSFPSESVEAELPSFPPPPLEEVLEGFDSLRLDMPDGSFSTHRDASTLSLASSSESRYSTGLTEDIFNSEYSFMTYSTSNYPSLFDLALSDIICDSEYNYIDPQHSSVFPESSGTSFQHDHVVKAQPDDGAGISPHCLSAAFQGPPPAFPIDPPADAASTTRVFTGPIRKEPTCDQCGRGKYHFYFIYFRDTHCSFLAFDRRSNLKAHMKTHDPNRERPFVCPESDCGYPFTRSHDLKRHLKKKHGGRAK
jgi:uncharacterized Zn-finger protein